MHVFWRTVWANTEKDLRIWLRQWSTIAATLLMPLTYVLVTLLASAARGQQPVALVIEDSGPVARQMAQALQDAQVFRLTVTDALTARQLYDNLEVAAIITIPTDFDERVMSGERAPLIVQVNNLNSDLTDELRRAVPDAIRVYYEQQSPNLLTITVDERHMHRQDIESDQFALLPLFSLLLLTHALISSGIATAREWEDQSIKELLLSPVSRTAILLGKVCAGFLSTFALSLLLFGLGSILGWTRPQGWYVGNVVLILALLSLFASALGIAMGSALRRVQSVLSLATTCSVWLFFFSGGMVILPFEPGWLKQLASFDPLTYGTHALQMAVLYASTDFLARDLAVLGGATLLVLLLGWGALQRRMTR